MSLLPSSRPDVQADQEGELRLLGLDDDTTDAVLDAISSETARTLLGQIHDEPQTPSELAAQTDTSLQNISYHLEKLEAAELIQVAGTQYSEKGREMKVYGPADEPLVMFVGSDERKLSFKQLLTRFIGATSLLAVLSILLHSLIEGGMPYISFTGAGGDGAGGGAAVEPALPLATALFLGGFVMLVLLFVWWYWEPELEGVLARIWDSPAFGGLNPDLSRRVALVAAGAFVVVTAFWLIVVSLELTVPSIGPFDPAPVLTILLVGAAAIQAYYNDGLLVSWLVVFAPIAGFGLGLIGNGLAADGLHTLAGTIGYAVILGTVAAVVLGTSGFLIGAGGRRLVSWISRTY